MTYVDMVTLWLMPQRENDSNEFIFQQDGAPPHFHCDVWAYLTQHLPQQWIGRVAYGDQALMRWPPWSLDLTLCSSFIWGYVEDLVYQPPLLATLDDLQASGRASAQHLRTSILTCFTVCWQKLNPRIDICRVTHGAPIQHVYGTYKEFESFSTHLCQWFHYYFNVVNVVNSCNQVILL